MGYYNRMIFLTTNGMADAFTICDNYFCSVIVLPIRIALHHGGFARSGRAPRRARIADHQSIMERV